VAGVDLLWLYVPVTLQDRAGYLQKSILVVGDAA
jgi:hypothetical protein